MTMIPGLMGLAFLLIVLTIVVGAMIHMVFFGTVLGLFVKRISDVAKEQAARAPRPCAYCAVTIPAGAEHCPGCGAKR